MEKIQKLKEKLQEIIESYKYTENSTTNRNNLYIEVRELLDKNGLEDLSFIVESMKTMIDRFSDYIPINYEELIDQLYIGPLPIAPLKDKLAWKFLIENK